jgi:outer membrane immunogenic protein
MKKLLLGSVVLAVLMGGSAMAADMPIKALPAQPPVLLWSGFYVGGSVGYLFGKTEWSYPGASIITSRDVEHQVRGVVGGVQAGINHQINRNWLVGIEAEFNWSNANGSSGGQSPSAPFIGCFNTDTCTTNVKWLDTFTARFGYIFGRQLVYVKAGGALVRDEYTDVRSNGIERFHGHQVRAGLVAGVGTEVMFAPHWTARVEYDAYAFGARRFLPVFSTLPGLAADPAARVYTRQVVHTAKIGINYLFNQGDPVTDLAAPVALADRSPAPPIQVASWTGFYAGFSLGGQVNDARWTTECLGLSPNFCPARSLTGTTIDASSPHTFNNVAARVGTYLGYNWQFAPRWLAGVEGEVAYAADQGKFVRGVVGCAIQCLVGVPLPDSAPDATKVKADWQANARLRLGMLLTPDVLLYGTGGVAIQNVEAQMRCGPIAATGAWCVTFRDGFVGALLAGWTAGGGVEFKYGNWLVRAEYRYADFGDWSHTFFLGTGDDVFSTVRLRTHAGMLGVGYKFGNESIVARY